MKGSRVVVALALAAAALLATAGSTHAAGLGADIKKALKEKKGKTYYIKTSLPYLYGRYPYGVFKRPLVIGLVFTFGWEPTVMALPGYLKQFTIAYYLQALVPHAMPSEGVTSLLQGFFRDTPSMAVSVWWLAVYAGLFLWLATRVVERREYVLEQ